jgi:hypothetical protein
MKSIIFWDMMPSHSVISQMMILFVINSPFARPNNRKVRKEWTQIQERHSVKRIDKFFIFVCSLFNNAVSTSNL